MTIRTKRDAKRSPAPKKRRAAATQVPVLSALPTEVAVHETRRIVTAPEILTMPSAQNARVLQAWGRLGDVDLSAIADKLREKSKAVIEGDTTTVEALLFDQALALQAIFTNLSIEASKAEYLGKLEPLLRLALKAQSQSRATLETLAMIKNPPVVYARQANIANGPQQVNNGTLPAAEPAPAVLPHSAPTELFEEAGHGSRMDARAARAHGGVDPHLATVGAIDGPEDRAGQGAQQEQPVPRRSAAAAPRDDARAARRDGRASRGARSAVTPRRRGGTR